MTNYDKLMDSAVEGLTLRGEYNVDGRLVGPKLLRDDLVRRLGRLIGTPVQIKLRRGKGHNAHIWALILE